MRKIILLAFFLLLSCINDTGNDKIDYEYEINLIHSNVDVDSTETIVFVDGEEHSTETFQEDNFVITFTADKSSDIEIKYNLFDDDVIIFTDSDSFNLQNIPISESFVKEIGVDTIFHIDTNTFFDTTFFSDTVNIIDTNMIFDTTVFNDTISIIDTTITLDTNIFDSIITITVIKTTLVSNHYYKRIPPCVTLGYSNTGHDRKRKRH